MDYVEECKCGVTLYYYDYYCNMITVSLVCVTLTTSMWSVSTYSRELM